MVIIGSGFAGLAAAYSALENGVKSVLVLEKMNIKIPNGNFYWIKPCIE